MFPLDEIADVAALRSEDPKLITRVITVELTQLVIWPRYLNVTDGRTDRRTDVRPTYDSWARTRGALQIH